MFTGGGEGVFLPPPKGRKYRYNFENPIFERSPYD